MPSSMPLLLLLLLIASVSSVDWTPLDDLIRQAITDRAFPGCQVSVGTNTSVLFRKNYGSISYRRQLFQVPVTNDTKYDIASVTKVMATTLAMMNMVAASSIRLNDPVATYITNYDTNKKSSTTIANLLLHNAGLPYDYPGPLPNAQQDVIDYITFIKPVYPIGSKFSYSNLGFLLLGKIVQKINKKDFNAYTIQNRIFAGLKDTNFNPTPAEFYRTAPCEYDTQIRHAIVRGKAHERLAYFFDGIAGHSGLFSNVDDIMRFMRLMLNKGRIPNENRILPQAIVDQFTTRVKDQSYDNKRSYGFDTVCHGTRMTDCFGHDGSTGVMAVADKARQVVVVVVSNRGHPDVNNQKFEEYKAKIEDLAMKILGY